MFARPFPTPLCGVRALGFFLFAQKGNRGAKAGAFA